MLILRHYYVITASIQFFKDIVRTCLSVKGLLLTYKIRIGLFSKMNVSKKYLIMQRLYIHTTAVRTHVIYRGMAKSTLNMLICIIIKKLGFRMS